MRYVMILAWLLVIPRITWGDETPQETQTEQLQSVPGLIAQTEEELIAYGEFMAKTDPDQTIQEAETFVQLFPESQLRPYVYSAAAAVYRKLNNYEKSLEYCEKALELDSNNVLALTLLSHTLPQRLKGSGLEQALKLGRALELANRGLVNVGKLVKHPDLTEEEFQAQKDLYSSMLHSARGMVYLTRRQLDKARVEYILAVDLAKNPDPIDYYRLGQVYENDRKFDEAIGAYETAARLGAGTVIEKYAEQQLDKIKKVSTVLGKSKK